MLLFGYYDSPFVRRVAVVLNHYAIPFERHPISVFTEFDDVLQVNPLGTMPVLELDSGDRLVDSRAILDYLHESVQLDRSLVPKEQPRRRVVLQTEVIALGLIEKTVDYRTETVRKAASARDEGWITRRAKQITSALAWLEERKPNPWLCDDYMTVADVTAAIAMTNLREKLPSILMESRYPGLARLCDDCEMLPAFRSAAYSRAEAALTPGAHDG